MVKEYIRQYVTFGVGEADKNFLHRAVKIAELKYGPVIRKEERLTIDTNTYKQSHDVAVQNLAQYMALMKIQKDKKQWFGQFGRTIQPTKRWEEHFINNNSSNFAFDSKITEHV